MSLSQDISTSPVNICVGCGYDIVHNIITIEGMCFHKYCYEQQAESVSKDPLYENNFELSEKANTNVKFTETEICPLLQVGDSSDHQPQNTNLPLIYDDMPDLIPNENLKYPSPEIKKGRSTVVLGPEIRPAAVLGPEIKPSSLKTQTSLNKSKKVTILEDRLPKVKLEHEEDSPDELNENNFKFGKFEENFEFNICLECKGYIDLSNPNTFLEITDNNLNFNMNDIIKSSKNVVNNFNEIGEKFVHHLDKHGNSGLKLYMHVECANYLKQEENKFYSGDKSNVNTPNVYKSNVNKSNANKQNGDEIPKETFDEVMNIMNIQKGKELETILTNLTVQLTNMNHKLTILERKIDHEQNRRELLGDSYSSNSNTKETQQVNAISGYEKFHISIVHLAKIMGIFNDELANFDFTLKNKDIKDNENIQKLIKKIDDDQDKNKKRTDILLDIVQDVESTLSGKIFEVSEKMEVTNKVVKKIETIAEQAQKTLETAISTFSTQLGVGIGSFLFTNGK